MLRFAVLALLGLMLAPLAARAQGSPVVVELYTSQGCSYCPPADRFLSELAEQEGVIALALHVDYWDYLGWRDEFGKPAHSKRQRAYAKAARTRTIYTPQMVVQGQRMFKGHDIRAVTADVAAQAAEPAPAALVAARDEGELVISVAPADPDRSLGASDVHVVEFLPSATVTIEGGENAGKRLTYSNVVTDWKTLGQWDGRTPAEFRVAIGTDKPVAVIVQRERLGPVLAAAELR